MKLETIAIHAGTKISDSHRPAVQPITLATTFEHHEESVIYARAANPNRNTLENVLARLEHGKVAAAFSSGNAAGMSVFQALNLGDHIIAPDDMYHGLRNQLTGMFEGILSVDFVDMTNSENVRKAIKKETVLVWVETPSNPLLKISNIKEICAIAKEKNITVVCDNTFATPVFQNPLLLGADLVMHSTTKYLGGHSDIMGGALISKTEDAFWEKIRNVQISGGAVPSPFDCYMLTRSIKTLPYRMKGHAEHAGIIATFLQNRPEVEKVYYPGLKDHQGHETAASQMSGFGGMLSFLVKGGAEKADQVISKLNYFTNATSLGGVESLIERRAASEGPDTKTPQNLIRVSVGLEHLDDLLEDLDQALK
ncbi:cystathionine beta-lyase/cystathionine gamma-synthase [Belliella baltica DSM 15883]|uniref:Cystathionine beta-lyase/cystathionine gamma-synthase n=1 Tax=Belliella baltica (strain DSM 15883 / CIP 108006 / LMG 21964 / BA134) TaxID=866536 RepID=I3Z0Y6_BELBD|nr:aminotransferase class I/II-fold pyridoxal phosphate-dependent enzyme [Belliella baltica]AFL82904.1 cystathionine beta-lyase/cystathionine gamma-synthase [Belliella baltica DSM 15883]